MRTRTKIILVAVVFVAVIIFVWPSDRDITNVPPRNDTIVAFGDSLVAGFGDKSGGGFVTDLENRFDKTIINEGVGGDTTQDGLDRINNALRHEPGVVLVLFGGNDYLQKVDKDTTRANLVEIIRRLQSNGAVVVLLGVRGGIVTDGYVDMYEDLVNTHGTAYVPDVLDDLIGDTELMHDKIHPNLKGYEHIANRVEPVLRELLDAK